MQLTMFDNQTEYLFIESEHINENVHLFRKYTMLY